MVDSSGQAPLYGEGQADPMAVLRGSLADAWAMGLQAWQVLAGIGAVDERDGPAGPAASRAESGGVAEPRPAAATEMADIPPALAEACMVGAASAIRYYGVIAELGLRYEASLARTVADRTTGRSAASPAECRARADELRAFLRGVADAANLEARLLQLNLERVGEKIAEAADQATPSPYPLERRRRHEVKP
jgi:hypothetical protein